MSPVTVGALDQRVGKLETAVAEGLKEIKQLIIDEIRELKAEQLADIRGTVNRVETTLKEELTRLADDQRRLWDKVGETVSRNEHKAIEARLNTLEKADERRAGGAKVLIAAWSGLSAMIAAVLTAGLEFVIFHH